jgi:hypothetical protein
VIRSFLAAFLMPGIVCADDGNSAVIRFSNQDQLGGALESMEKDRLVWSSPIQSKPSAFWLKEVLDLSLSADTPVIKASHEATLTLARGDSVRGQIASVSDEAIELDTWFAGRMTFPRVMVRDVKISDRPELLFRGPSSFEGWTQTEPAPWKYQAASFRSVAAGSIGRDVELPGEFRLAFDAAWRDMLNLSVIIYSDDVSNEDPENGYEVAFNRSVRLQRLGAHNFIGSTQAARELQEDEKARIEIRASTRTKTVCFSINGRLIEVWTDPSMDRENLGTGIQFISRDNSRMKISGIEVSSWDGVLDETPRGNAFANRLREMDFRGIEEKKEVEVLPEGRMLLRNGDSIEGQVLAIADGTITLKTAYGDVKLPVARFRSIALKPASLEEPKRENGDVRAWFMDGSSLVFRLESFRDGKISGFSQNFGTVDFDMKAFTRLEFNIYNPKLDPLREQGGW